jgi:hypothetical protein
MAKKTENITTYKGFDSAFRCRGHQYEIGKTYKHDGPVKICESGFHACEYPLDIFGYYPPAGSRFAQVEQSGKLERHGSDTKVCSKSIKIVAELTLPGLIKAAIDYTFSRSIPEDGASATGYQGAASATGVRGAASATGERGAASATGVRGAASATGDQGAASATGVRGAASATGVRGAASATGYQGAASATGVSGAAMAAGWRGRAMGAEGNALFLVERDVEDNILAVWAGLVGRDGIEPNVWYTLQNGKPVVCQE